MVDDGRINLTVRGEEGRERSLLIDVGDDSARLTEPGLLFDGLGFSPWQPPAVVGEVLEGGAAQIAGLESGDLITRIDGEAVDSFGGLSDIVASRPGETVAVEATRNGGRSCWT